MAPRPPATGEALRREADALAAALPPLLIEARRVAQTVTAGLHGRRRAGPGETFWQHRPYVFGDPVSAIDWRQSARTPDRLYVRQNEWEAAATVWIWRDPSRSLDYSSESGLSTKRLRADVLATALALLLAEGGERVGWIDAAPRVFQGRRAGERLFETMMAQRFDDKASVPPDAPIRPFSCVVYLSDFLCEPSAFAAAAARVAALGAGGVLVEINDPAEETFPFAGRTEFEDMESPARMRIGDAARLGEAYRTAFGAHRAAVAQIAAGLGWPIIRHRTDAPASAALLSLYAALNPRGAQ